MEHLQLIQFEHTIRLNCDITNFAFVFSNMS